MDMFDENQRVSQFMKTVSNHFKTDYNPNSLILIITKTTNNPFNFSGKDKKLFTPGPLLCSSTIKKAMQRDLGSRDVDFIQTVKDVRSELLKVAGERL